MSNTVNELMMMKIESIDQSGLDCSCCYGTYLRAFAATQVDCMNCFSIKQDALLFADWFLAAETYWPHSFELGL